MEDATRRIDHLEREIRSLEREEVTGVDHAERLTDLRAQLEEVNKELEVLNTQWEKEKELTSKMRDLRFKLEMSVLGGSDEPTEPADATGAETTDAPESAAAATAETTASPTADGTGTATAPEAGAPADHESLRAELVSLNAELREVQGDVPLMSPVVDSNAIADVISGWTGIPVGKMVADEIRQIISLEKTLGERVLGQDHALTAIAERIKTSRAKLTDPKRPIGVFLLVGNKRRRQNGNRPRTC